MIFKKFFKRRYPYAPIAFLGRKTVEQALGADITKFKKLEKELREENTKDDEQVKDSKADK